MEQMEGHFYLSWNNKFKWALVYKKQGLFSYLKIIISWLYMLLIIRAY